MTTLESHYDVLGLSRDADAAQIRNAWAKLVRIHTPDKDPEGNRRINEAKTTLLNEEVRRDYDALLDYGDDIVELLEEAQEAEERQDWDAAIKANKEILAYHPTNHAARNHLALCQSYSGDNRTAAKTLEGLLQKKEDVALYWSNFGLILQEVDDEDEALLNKAASAFERAAQLEPHNAQHHVNLSRHWRYRGDFQRAEKYVEDAIHADGKFDIDDLDTLFELPWIHLWAREFHKLGQDAERIRQLLPQGNEDAEDYASFRFLEIANDAKKAGYFAEATEFIKAARVIKSDLGDLEPWAKEVDRAGRIDRQAKLLREDEIILKPVQGLGLIYSDIYLARSTFEECESVIDNLIEALGTWSQSQVIGAFRDLRMKYPAVYEVNDEFFGRLSGLGQTDQSSAAPSSSGSTNSVQNPSSSEGAGCFGGIVIGAFIGAIFGGWGAIPGAVIGGIIGASVGGSDQSTGASIDSAGGCLLGAIGELIKGIVQVGLGCGCILAILAFIFLLLMSSQ